MSGPSADRNEYGSQNPGAKARRDMARKIGDVRQWLGINGGARGTSGYPYPAFWTGLLGFALIVGAVNLVNVISAVQNRVVDNWWSPIVWESSSWLSFLVMAWLPWSTYRLAPPAAQTPALRYAIHLPAAVAFSALHVLLFLAIRTVVYAAWGAHYRFFRDPAGFLFELPKDALAYLLLIALFALGNRLREGRESQRLGSDSQMFGIRDGRRVVRVPVAEILAIASAGNYVEFVLRDGRRLLMRSPLSAIEDELAPHGFLRVHRSWLVNPARMTELAPEGSGDYTVKLGDLSVPLSRRFPDALAKLRAA
jgi:DNA-binding LytR/AlgR family response regulator